MWVCGEVWSSGPAGPVPGGSYAVEILLRGVGGFGQLPATTLRILGLSMAGVGPSIAGVRALKTLSV